MRFCQPQKSELFPSEGIWKKQIILPAPNETKKIECELHDDLNSVEIKLLIVGFHPWSGQIVAKLTCLHVCGEEVLAPLPGDMTLGLCAPRGTHAAVLRPHTSCMDLPEILPRLSSSLSPGVYVFPPVQPY